MASAVQPFESRLDEIVRRRRELDAQEAEWITIVGEYERSRDWQADGYLSAAAALRDRCHLTHGMAAAAVRLACRLVRLPHTAAAFAAGEISRQHAKVVADACTPERAVELEAGDHELAAAARHVHANDLRDLVRYATDAIDGDGGATSDAEEHQLNRFHASLLAGRVVTDGSFDKESGEIVITALHAMDATLHERGDRRSGSARHADALVEICRRSLARDDACAPASRRGRPHVSVVVDLRTLQGRRPELVTDVRAEAEHAGRLSRATLERLACDCHVSRVIADGPSQVVDVGRATRTVPQKLWNALVVRDRHCCAPGCDRPPGWCEAHHIRHWSRGGPTDLANLRLLCWQHHRQQHLHGSQPRPG